MMARQLRRGGAVLVGGDHGRSDEHLFTRTGERPQSDGGRGRADQADGQILQTARAGAVERASALVDHRGQLLGRPGGEPSRQTLHPDEYGTTGRTMLASTRWSRRARVAGKSSSGGYLQRPG